MGLQLLQHQAPQTLAAYDPVLPLWLMMMRIRVVMQNRSLSGSTVRRRGGNGAPVASDDLAAAVETVVNATANTVSRYVYGQLLQCHHALLSHKLWSLEAHPNSVTHAPAELLSRSPGCASRSVGPFRK